MNNTQVTLKAFMTSIMPEWEKIEDWYSWPPDTFLLTSLILSNTGAYRYVVSPPRGLWPEERDWDQIVADEAGKWRDWLVSPGMELPGILRSAKLKLESSWDKTPLAALRSIPSSRDTDATDRESPWTLCRALLELHAVADEACRGFGLPSGSYSRLKPRLRSEMNAIDYMANMLLVMTGSLSRVPLHYGAVLPKMRTPQVGLTLRSISHHVTFHQSEVEVTWRTTPWINIDENTINVLIIPWPEEMKPHWFRSKPHFVRRNSSEPTRYFSYTRGRDPLAVEKVKDLVEEAQKSVNRVHIIAFPELALTQEELGRIKDMLAKTMTRDCVPMIISGLCDETQDDNKDESGRLGHNKVVLSTFFSGKWYDLYQSKHHRWKLDNRQVQQYGLGGILTGAKDWWEAIEVPERRLTFMAPNGWLTLCPLICEDLARQEPISDLIRGVGPTLLIAILLDGPQIRERWPGRYASVLADDPGTSVLTVSSLGMARRSTPQTRHKVRDNVALWKDQITGWSDIRLEQEQDAVVVTLAATWVEEFTADGRGDEKSAAVFAIQGSTGIHYKAGTQPPCGESEWEPRKYETSSRTDIDELTTFAYLVDAALDSKDQMKDNLRQWAIGERNNPDWLESDFRARDSIWKLIVQEYEHLYKEASPPTEFCVLARWFIDVIKRITLPGSNTDDLTEYWERLVSKASNILDNAKQDKFLTSIERDDSLDTALKADLPVHEALRIQIYTALSILWAVHRRLAKERRVSGLTFARGRLIHRIECLLPGRYDNEWYRAKEAATGKG